MTLQVPIVGMHFRPPAKIVLGALASGTPLVLQPEPDNPYDAKAVRVLVEVTDIPESQHETLREQLPLTGNDLDELLSGEAGCLVDGMIFLGYIADSDGKEVAKLGCKGNREVHDARGDSWGEDFAKLAFGPDGKPQALVESV